MLYLSLYCTHSYHILVLYADGVVILSYNVDGMQHLLEAFKAFCRSSGLTASVDKTKMMVVRTIQPHQYPMLTYKGDHLQFVQSFKSLGINVLATNNGVYALSLHFKMVGKVIICWKINATRVILMDGK